MKKIYVAKCGRNRHAAANKIKRILDSGSDEHIRGKLYHPVRSTGTPISFDTVKGTTSTSLVMDVTIPGGNDTAFYLKDSVDVDFLGKIVIKSRKAFLWDPDYSSEPLQS